MATFVEIGAKAINLEQVCSVTVRNVTGTPGFPSSGLECTVHFAGGRNVVLKGDEADLLLKAASLGIKP